MRRIGRIVTVLAVLAALLCCGEALADGKCGDSLTWSLSSGKLTISGTGKMWDYDNYSGDNISPFYDNDSITELVIKEGVTSVGASAFESCDGLKSVKLPYSVTSVGKWAFYCCYSLTEATTERYKDLTIGEGAFKYCAEDFTLRSWKDSAAQTWAEANDVAFEALPQEGQCGDDVTWEVDPSMRYMWVSGSGPMWDYHWKNNPSPFEGNEMITGVYVNGPSSVGAWFFDECHNLNNINFGWNLDTIGTGAFYNTAAKSVMIPGTVNKIGDYAFSRSADLKSVGIGNPNASIGSSAFQDCASGLTLYGFTGSTAQSYASDNGFGFSLPQYGDGITCDLDSSGTATFTGMGAMKPSLDGASLFGQNPAVRSAEFGEGVTSISAYLFLNSENLTEVTFPSTLTEIGYAAFIGCSGLTEIDLPEGLKTISGLAFDRTGLSEVTIPDSVELIDGGAFMNCGNLKSVLVLGRETKIEGIAFKDCHPDLTLYCFENSEAEKFAKDNEISFSRPKCGENVTWDLKNGVLIISGSGAMDDYPEEDPGYYAMRDRITAIQVKKGVTRIGDYAFYDLNKAESVTIEYGVAAIGKEAFYKCSALKSIDLPRTVKSIESWAFEKCGSLDEVIIRSSQCTVGEHAFDGCFAYMEMQCWEGSPAETFAKNSGITCKATPVSGQLGDHITFKVKDDNYLVIEGSGPMWDAGEHPSPFMNSRLIESLYIESGITSIPDSFLYGCSDLRSLSLPPSVESIGTLAFMYCTGMEYIEADLDGLKTIGSQAFYGCINLQRLMIHHSVKEIGNSAFSGCKNLEDAYILSPDVKLGTNVFRNCDAALKIYGFSASTAETYAKANSIPFTAWPVSGECGDNVTWKLDPYGGTLTISGTGPMKDYDSYLFVPWYEFRSAIANVVFEKGVTSVGTHAFEYCLELIRTTISDTVASIETSAFNDCYHLDGVVIPDSVTTIKKNAFRSTGLTSLTIPGSVKDLGDQAFYSCRYLASLTLSDGVETIGENAFAFCGKLTRITFPDSVTSIGQGAFEHCDKLAEVTIPVGITTIEAYAFGDCKALTDVTIPPNITAIGAYAFAETGLSGITVPVSVNAIGKSAFIQCASLKSATVYHTGAAFEENVFKGTPSEFVLYGWAGSTTEAYAKANGLTFKALSAPEPALFLPANLQTIQAEAFSGIRAQAVVIPKTVTSFTGNPFAMSSVVCIYGYFGSAAQSLAATYGYAFVTIDDAWMASHK